MTSVGDLVASAKPAPVGDSVSSASVGESVASISVGYSVEMQHH